MENNSSPFVKGAKLMNKKAMRFIEIGNSFWNIPSFVVLFIINSITLLLKLTHHTEVTEKLDYIEIGIMMVFVLELYLKFRKPKKEKKEKIAGHMATCMYPATCKCGGEY